MPFFDYILSLITNPADKVKLDKMGNLYIGSKNALDIQFLKENNISVIVSLCPVNASLKKIRHYRYKVNDHVSDESRLKQFLPTILNTIHRERTLGHNVLVHCRAGIQRAPTVVTEYLKQYYQMSTALAIQRVRSVRPIAFINGYTFKGILGI